MELARVVCRESGRETKIFPIISLSTTKELIMARVIPLKSTTAHSKGGFFWIYNIENTIENLLEGSSENHPLNRELSIEVHRNIEKGVSVERSVN
jgi:hypothetical protein